MDGGNAIPKHAGPELKGSITKQIHKLQKKKK
jgi:hypothetical protein